MSRSAPEEAETIVALLLKQSLDFELSFSSSGKCNSQVKSGLAIGRLALENGFDQHECRASQNPIDQKEILKTVCVNRRNPPLFHSQILPSLAKFAKGKTSTALTYVANQMCLSPSKYGDLSAQVDSMSQRFVPNPGTLSSSAPYNPATLQLTSRQNVGRGRFDHSAGSRSEGTKTHPHAANLIPLPSGSIARPEPVFERGNLSQALLDVCALIFLFLFIIVGSLSLPLAIGLLIFARF